MSKISCDLNQSKTLNLNIYEVRIDEEFLKDPTLIETFLYECQCALFLVDITNSDSFNATQVYGWPSVSLSRE